MGNVDRFFKLHKLTDHCMTSIDDVAGRLYRLYLEDVQHMLMRIYEKKRYANEIIGGHYEYEQGWVGLRMINLEQV